MSPETFPQKPSLRPPPTSRNRFHSPGVFQHVLLVSPLQRHRGAAGGRVRPAFTLQGARGVLQALNVEGLRPRAFVNFYFGGSQFRFCDPGCREQNSGSISSPAAETRLRSNAAGPGPGSGGGGLEIPPVRNNPVNKLGECEGKSGGFSETTHVGPASAAYSANGRRVRGMC